MAGSRLGDEDWKAYACISLGVIDREEKQKLDVVYSVGEAVVAVIAEVLDMQPRTDRHLNGKIDAARQVLADAEKGAALMHSPQSVKSNLMLSRGWKPRMARAVSLCSQSSLHNRFA